ncbi:MAG: hypothetical protein EOM55_03815 [Clostridia bacterium]|nr:hypothetical protein [Clostridia bacterium]
MILEEIKKANVQAMRDRDQNARAVYSVVMTKAMLEIVKKREKSEEFADADMSQILQKTIKELAEEKENYKKAGNSIQAEMIEKQKNILSKFLPQMLSEKEIYDIIQSQDDKSIPSIMKLFKQNYAGKVDMAKVGMVLKNL